MFLGGGYENLQKKKPNKYHNLLIYIILKLTFKLHVCTDTYVKVTCKLLQCNNMYWVVFYFYKIQTIPLSNIYVIQHIPFIFAANLVQEQ